MKPLRLSTVIGETVALAQRFGMGLYAEFLAAGVLMTTLEVLVSPEGLRARYEPGVEIALAQVFFDPFVLLHEALFSVIVGAACLRIWWAMTDDTAPAGAVLGRTLAPLVVLNVATGFLTFFGLMLMIVPGLVLAAALTVLVPVIVIEEQGWIALPRSLGLVRGAILKLTALWAMILIPWLFLTVATSPDPLAIADATDGQMWLMLVLSDLFSPAMAALSTCATMAIYRQLVSGERQTLDEVFR